MNEHLKKFRESQGLSPKDMAVALKISASYYYKLEQGIRPPTYAILKNFKEKFKLPVDGILI